MQLISQAYPLSDLIYLPQNMATPKNNGRNSQFHYTTFLYKTAINADKCFI